MNKKQQQHLARVLRRAQTPAEKTLWTQLRKKAMSGFKFHRQYIIRHQDPHGAAGFFIADFYCAPAKLIIEVDGEIHKKQLEYDRARDKIISSLGITVLRISNEYVLNDIEGVMAKISTHLSDSPSLP